MSKDDVNDAFDALVGDLDLEIPTGPEHKFGEWPSPQLMEEFHRVKEVLMGRGALLYPETDEDKDLQGYYFGIVGEMRKRRLM